MLTLGLDISWTGTGIVVIRGARSTVCRRLVGSEASDGEAGWRMDLVLSAVREVLDEFPMIERVGIEDYARGKLNRREEMGEITGPIKHLLWQRELAYITCAPQQLKKWVLGKAVNGDLGKQLMLAAAQEMGCRTFDHNVADGFHVARWANTHWSAHVE